MASHAQSHMRILVINPNTSQAMTDALKPMVEALGYDAQYKYFTCPGAGIRSINSPEDAADSARYCAPHLLPLLSEYDGFLIACYSEHPLVNEIRARTLSAHGSTPQVLGIFEASVFASLGLLSGFTDRDGESESSVAFGIVSTGKVWETALDRAVSDLLPAADMARYAGCETTGLNATELHELAPEAVAASMKAATQRLIRRGAANGRRVRAICLGCAGMVGLESVVREACIQELGAEVGSTVEIVDGVRAGIAALVDKQPM